MNNALTLLNESTALINNNLVATVASELNNDVANYAKLILSAEKTSDVSELSICMNTNYAVYAIETGFNGALVKGKKKKFAELMGITQSEVTRRCNVANLIEYIIDNANKFSKTFGYAETENTEKLGMTIAAKYPKSALNHMAKVNENFREDMLSCNISDMSVRNIEFCLGAFNVGSYAKSVMGANETRLDEFNNRIAHIRANGTIADYGKVKTEDKTDSKTEDKTDNKQIDSKTDSKTDSTKQTEVKGISNLKFTETGAELVKKMIEVCAQIDDETTLTGIIQVCNNRRKELETTAKKSAKK